MTTHFPMSHTAIIIVNWNGLALLKACLAALSRQTFMPDRIIVIDNGSTDGSVAWMNEQQRLELITLPSNTGFAHPNNLGIARALTDVNIQYVVTLNNDTEPDPHYLEELIACTKRHPDAGSIQPKVINANDTTLIDTVGILIHQDMSAMNKGQREKDTGQYEAEEEVFAASASAALYTRRSLEAVALPKHNYFDAAYFAYYEDVDLAWRLRLAGYTSYYAPAAIVKHQHSATGVSHSPFKAFHIHRNHYYNIIKDLPFPFAIRAFALLPMRYLLLITSILRKKGPSAELAKRTKKSYGIVQIVLASWRDILVNMPSLLRKRRFIQQRRTVSLRTIHRWFRQYHASLEKIIFGAR